MVFAGTFTAGGLGLAVQDGSLRILHGGRAQKFGKAVQQITFSGKVAAAAGKPVLYVTGRCVFRLTAAGLELTEVAPGIDVGRDILAHMRFRPIVGNVCPMDPRIFRPEPMDLKGAMLNLDLSNRLAFDADRNTLFLNFEGVHIRQAADIEAIKAAVIARCTEIGRRVAAVVNCDAFRLDQDLAGAYADMVRSLEEQCCTRVSRHATSAFVRVKLGQAPTRTVRPHIFESRADAQAFHDTIAGG